MQDPFYGINVGQVAVADLGDLRPAGHVLEWYDGLDAFVRLQNATASLATKIE